ncbi:MAG: OmpH family outer membrane protein [bacterium]|nr:OmpH family outer membrane protein [bacterium]
MKRILLVFFIAIAANFSFGQKTGHINTLELIDKMPEKAQAQEKLNNLQIETDAMLKELVVKYTNLGMDIEEQGETWSAVILQMKKNELLRMEQTIQDAKILAEKEFVYKEQELLAPILDKALAAIETVAEKRGYDYVIDTAAGSTLLSPKEHDLMEDVLTELGL